MLLLLMAGSSNLQGREYRQPYQHSGGQAFCAARRGSGSQTSQRRRDLRLRDAEEVLRLAAEAQRPQRRQQEPP